MLSDIFEHIDEQEAAEYLDEMDIKKAAAILSAMETDAVVDVLQMIPKEKKNLLIELMDDDARKIWQSSLPLMRKRSEAE